MISQSYFRILSAMLLVTQTCAFSMGKIAAQVGCQVAANMAKQGACFAWARVKAMRGIDIESLAATSRLAETASEQLWPTFVKDSAHLAPETVPASILDRVDRLKRGDYSWPTCKPTLFVGPPGTGKTERPRYVAHETGCPLVCDSASSLYGARKNLATELIRSLFKRARYRTLATTTMNCLKKIGSLITLRGWCARKPSIIHIEEFNGLGLATRFVAQSSDDRDLERERANAFNRLIWELNRNPHNSGMPEELRNWSRDLPANHIMRILIDIEPHLPMVIPNYSCPPATLDEKSLTFCFYKWIIRKWICGYVRSNKKPVEEKNIARLLTDDTIIPVMWAYQHHKCPSLSRWSLPIWFLSQSCRFSNWLAANDPTDALVIATTNAATDHLDPRVKRLFDIIEVRQPGASACKQILEYHARGKPFDQDVHLTEVAARLEGSSPDCIAHVIRYAALHAAADGRTSMSNADINYAYEKLCSRDV